jgi:putative heme iron utilization protein
VYRSKLISNRRSNPGGYSAVGKDDCLQEQTREMVKVHMKGIIKTERLNLLYINTEKKRARWDGIRTWGSIVIVVLVIGPFGEEEGIYGAGAVAHGLAFPG